MPLHRLMPSSLGFSVGLGSLRVCVRVLPTFLPRRLSRLLLFWQMCVICWTVTSRTYIHALPNVSRNQPHIPVTFFFSRLSQPAQETPVRVPTDELFWKEKRSSDSVVILRSEAQYKVPDLRHPCRQRGSRIGYNIPC